MPTGASLEAPCCPPGAAPQRRELGKHEGASSREGRRRSSRGSHSAAASTSGTESTVCDFGVMVTRRRRSNSSGLSGRFCDPFGRRSRHAPPKHRISWAFTSGRRVSNPRPSAWEAIHASYDRDSAVVAFPDAVNAALTLAAASTGAYRRRGGWCNRELNGAPLPPRASVPRQRRVL